MKRLLLIAFGLATLGLQAFGQRYAYVDTEYILGELETYKAAQEELDELSAKWQKTVEAKYAEIDRLWKAYQAEKILLSEEMRQKREQEIVDKEKEAKEYQKKKFGVEGELFQKRQELIKPIQDDVYDAIKYVAERGSYAVIFDKASSSNILYANPKYDKSDEVLRRVKD